MKNNPSAGRTNSVTACCCRTHIVLRLQVIQMHFNPASTLTLYIFQEATFTLPAWKRRLISTTGHYALRSTYACF